MSSGSDFDVAEDTPLLSSNAVDSIDWWGTWKIVRPYVTPASNRLRLLALLSLVCELLYRATLLLPGFGIKLIVDSLSHSQRTQTASFPYIPVVVYVTGNFLSNLLGTLHNVSYTVVESDCSRRFSIDMYVHLLTLNLAFHLKRKTGEISKVWDRGMDSINTLAYTIIFTILPTIVEAAMIISVFLRLGTPVIALVIFLTVAFYFVFTVFVTQWRNKHRQIMNDVENITNDKVIDTLINYETVKIFGREKDEISDFTELENRFRRILIWYHISFNVLNFGQDFVLKFGLTAVLILAVREATVGSLSAGDLVLVLVYSQQVFSPLLSLGNSYRVVNQAFTDLERCIKLLEVQPTIIDAPNAVVLPKRSGHDSFQKSGEVIFKDVSFSYVDEKDDAGGLKEINFRVHPGQTVAFIGASGTGKSTLVRLLLRLYDVDQGSVLINGADVRMVTQRSLREQIGVVAQDTSLFNQDLRYNIAYGKEGASDIEVYSAARSASLGPFIEKLPQGLDTEVGERGIRLSGGEKQRVGIARCIIKRPSIIIFDEDSLTEREMQTNLEEVCRGRSTLIIAHRLSTIMMADQIFVLGKRNQIDLHSTIVEHGTHEQLIRMDGIYADMWKTQSAGGYK